MALLAIQSSFKLPDGSRVDFDVVKENFFGNIDENCFMANSDGNVKVIASMLAKKKTEANRDDCRASITSGRIGNAVGTQDHFIFSSSDGFGLHVNVHQIQVIFSEHKILILKKGSDSFMSIWHTIN